MPVSQELEELIITITPKLSPQGQASLQALRVQLAEARAQGDRAAQALGTGLPAAMDRTARASSKVVDGSRKIQNAWAALALQAVGLQGPMGRLAEGLLLFAAGSATVTAIAAGIAIIGFAIKKLGEDSAEASKAIDEMVRKFRDATGATMQARIDVARAALTEIQRQIAETEREIAAPAPISGFASKAGVQDQLNADRLAGLNKQLTDLRQRAGEAAGGLALAEAELQAFQETIGDAGGPEGGVATVVKRLEELGEAITNLAADTQITSLGNLRDALAEIGAEMEKLANKQVLTIGGKSPLNAFQQGLLSDAVRLDSLMENLEKNVTGGGSTRARQLERTVRDTARETEAIARGTIDAARGFGLLNDEAAATLNSVVGIGSAIESIAKGGASIGSIVGLAGGIIGTVGSMLGESPQERAAREAVERNTQALDRLTKGLDSVGLDSSSQDQRAALRAITQFQSIAAGLPERRQKDLDRILQDVGLSFSDLERIAESFGIELVRFEEDWGRAEESLEQFRKALDTAPGGRFGEGLADQLEALRASLDIRGIDNPIQRLKELAQVLGSQDLGLLDNVLRGLDVGTVGGRATLQRFLETMIEQLRAGVGTDTGAATGQEFRDLLEQLADALAQANEFGRVGGDTEQFGISQTITVAQASQILALQTTANVWAQRTAENTENLAPMRQLLEQIAASQGGVAVSSATASPASARSTGDYAAARGIALGANRKG